MIVLRACASAYWYYDMSVCQHVWMLAPGVKNKEIVIIL